MPVQRVVVEVHFRVEREQVAGPGDDQRVDLDHRGIRLDEGFVQRGGQRDELVDLRSVEPDREPDLTRLERHEADPGLDMHADDLLGRRGGDFLDVHPPRGAGHQDRLAGGPIEQQADVQLARHVHAFFDEHPAHDAALGSGLMRDERHPEHVVGDCLGLVRRVRKLDATAFPAAACMNLGLDHHLSVSANPLRDLARRCGVERHLAARDGNAVPGKDRLGLILVNFHVPVRSRHLVIERTTA